MSQLTHEEIIRALQDAEYRKTLTEEQLQSLPSSPTQEVELNEDELDSVAGGMDFIPPGTNGIVDGGCTEPFTKPRR